MGIVMEDEDGDDDDGKNNTSASSLASPPGLKQSTGFAARYSAVYLSFVGIPSDSASVLLAISSSIYRGFGLKSAWLAARRRNLPLREAERRWTIMEVGIKSVRLFACGKHNKH
jgi:hypothetical protein